MVTWVTWVRGLCGSTGPWVAWVKFLCGLRRLRGSKYFLHVLAFYVGNNFYMGCVGQNFLRGSLRESKVFAWVQNFSVGQVLFTGRDYFTILQLIVSRVSSQQILIKPCLTSLVFLSGLVPKTDLGTLQRFIWS